MEFWTFIWFKKDYFQKFIGLGLDYEVDLDLLKRDKMFTLELLLINDPDKMVNSVILSVIRVQNVTKITKIF